MFDQTAAHADRQLIPSGNGTRVRRHGGCIGRDGASVIVKLVSGINRYNRACAGEMSCAAGSQPVVRRSVRCVRRRTARGC